MAPAELIRKTDDGQVKSKQTSTCHLHTDPGEHGRSNPKTVCVCTFGLDNVPVREKTLRALLCYKPRCCFCLAHLFLPRFLPPYVYVSFKPTLFFFFLLEHSQPEPRMKPDPPRAITAISWEIARTKISEKRWKKSRRKEVYILNTNALCLNLKILFSFFFPPDYYVFSSQRQTKYSRINNCGIVLGKLKINRVRQSQLAVLKCPLNTTQLRISLRLFRRIQRCETTRTFLKNERERNKLRWEVTTVTSGHDHHSFYLCEDRNPICPRIF